MVTHNHPGTPDLLTPLSISAGHCRQVGGRATSLWGSVLGKGTSLAEDACSEMSSPTCQCPLCFVLALCAWTSHFPGCQRLRNKTAGRHVGPTQGFLLDSLDLPIGDPCWGGGVADGEDRICVLYKTVLTPLRPRVLAFSGVAR